MKPRRFSKELILNKKTIVNLNDVTMKRARAGGPTVPDTEITYCSCTCFTNCGSIIPEECCKTNPTN